MSWIDCYSRECKLGWGYNESLNLLIPVEGQPVNVKSELQSDCWYGVVGFSSGFPTYYVGFLNSLNKSNMNILEMDQPLSGAEMQKKTRFSNYF